MNDRPPWDPMQDAADGLPEEELGYGPLGPTVIRYSQVKRKKVYWLWPQRLPAGKLALLDGDPDVGKSTLMVDLAARFTTGSPLPDGYMPPCPINVLFLRGEDGAADTVLPRLLASGGDPDRFLELEAMPDIDASGKVSSRPPVLPLDLPGLEDVIRVENIGLVLIDPLMAFLSDNIDSHRDQQVRRALSPMAELAQRAHVTILALRHLNKTIGAPTLYRGGGSIGLLAAARLVMVAGHDPDNEGRRLLAVYKSNLAPKPETLAYRIMPNDLYDCGQVMWQGASNKSGADILHLSDVDDSERAALDEAIALLFQIVDGPTPAREVHSQARQAGISDRLLGDARRSAGFLIRRERGKGKGGQWLWEAPDPERLFESGGELGQPVDPHENEPDD